jgi:hypothetical protein
MPYRMDEERQQRVIAAFNAGRKSRAVANEVLRPWLQTVTNTTDQLSALYALQTGSAG